MTTGFVKYRSLRSTHPGMSRALAGARLEIGCRGIFDNHWFRREWIFFDGTLGRVGSVLRDVGYIGLL